VGTYIRGLVAPRIPQKFKHHR